MAVLTDIKDLIISRSPELESDGSHGIMKEKEEEEEEGVDIEGNVGIDFTEDEADHEEITLHEVQSYKRGEMVHPYLPGLPVVAEISSNLTHNRSRGPQFRISLEHGPFVWNVYKYYTDFLSLRHVLAPLRVIITGRIGRGRKRGYLPHLFTIVDINPLQISRTQNQIKKVKKFLNAVLNDREFRSHRSTLKFLEISRLSFVESLGSKRKEGVITKRSGGHRRVTNCLGCGAFCACHCSVWRQRWLILKDTFLAYIRSDRRTIAGILLFDEDMTVSTGSIQTRLLYGLEIKTMSRTLLINCPSNQAMKEWKNAIQSTMASTGHEWVSAKRFNSFAPPRKNCTLQWLVDGEKYMSQVANALLAAKEEIYITDWMISPQIYLIRSKDTVHNLNYRLDKILFRKAKEGVKIYIQVYKDITVAVDLGSEYAKEEFRHPNITFFRHPEHIQTGVYLWAHHEKIVVVDQTLAFVGGIDLAFGRYDDHCHDLGDPGHSVQLQTGGTTKCYKWIGKDYHNPFIRDITKHHEPNEDELVRTTEQRMPWHDIGSCFYGAPARDVARHFIQRYNFTRHEQSLLDNLLLPRSAFSASEAETKEFRYLQDVIRRRPTTDCDIQILRSVSQWSTGTSTEHSILNAYLETIEKAEHFIYIENQFFISSQKEVKNSIAEALRVRIRRAYTNKEVFRVIVVMPLLPSFAGDFTDNTGVVLRAVVHWNYKTISRGEDSLFSKLTEDGIPFDEIQNYISVYGLRTFGKVEGEMTSEIIYIHSKCMVVDDRYTIIGSANINDRSTLGERDSEMAIFVEDRDLLGGTMNGKSVQVGRFSHSLRCHLFREHLGLLEEQCHHHGKSNTDSISVEDPLCEKFYGTWMRTAEDNMKIYEEVFGGKIIPTDNAESFAELKKLREVPGLIETDPASGLEMLNQIQGHIVPMPLQFLKNEALLPPFGTKEAIAPDLFT